MLMVVFLCMNNVYKSKSTGSLCLSSACHSSYIINIAFLKIAAE